MIGIREGPGSPHDRLSQRQLAVLRRIAAGKAIVTIAKEFGVTMKTISTCRMHILETLQLADTAALIAYATKHGLIDSP
jgi:two-component system, NarL family, invasion response regulator UvrY